MTHQCLLKRVEEQELTAKDFGFYWERIDQLIEQIHSECKEVEAAWSSHNRENLQEELGDLLLAVVSLIVFCQFDPHETLLKSTEKFQKRYDALVQLVKDSGHLNLCHQPFDVLIDYWKRAKKHHPRNGS